MPAPRIQYARAPDGVNIAFTTYGEGGTPLVYLEPPHMSHLQGEWQMPWNRLTHKLERLSARRMVVRFDPRGSGLSDRGVTDHSLEARVSDLAAVVDRLELERFSIHAVRNASLVGLAYAAENPGRVTHLALEDGFSRGMDFWDTPINRGLIALAEYVWDVFTETNARVSWGWEHNRPTPGGLAGDLALDYARHTRMCITQGDFLSWATAELAIDVRPMLPSIHVPSIVTRQTSGLMRGDDADASRRLATGLASCRFVLANDVGTLLDAIDELLEDGRAPATAAPAFVSPGLRTILFTDLEGHTAMMQRLGDDAGREVLREHERITRDALSTYGGSEVKALGDGFLASFGSAQRAIECAVALQRVFSELGAQNSTLAGLKLRVGLNAGEPIHEDDDLFGSSVIAAARIAAQALGGQVLVTDVVRQLTSGKGFTFSDLGERTLRGFSEPVRAWELLWE